MSDLTSVHRPSYGTQTGRVWEIADKISRELGRKAKRQEVMDAFAREGGNANTASTQYSHWNKGPLVVPRAPVKKGVSLDVSPTRLEIGRDGRIFLPLEIRLALRLGETSTLTAEVQDGVLTLISPKTAAIKLQQLIKATDKGSGSVVGELIAERRAENAME
jgi:bifunctional DNA-binding transcriptional regulator/antitoxin component of YhaV-PrlF toxin-antitoxin module